MTRPTYNAPVEDHSPFIHNPLPDIAGISSLDGQGYSTAGYLDFLLGLS